MPITKYSIFPAIALAGPCIAGSTTLPHGVSRADLCVTEGTINELPGSSGLTVDSPKMRAYVNAEPVQSIEARFTYLGATSHDIPLGSGAMRRQFGLKLRAQDACNLIYAMWRIEPESKLVVSIKENPGQHSSPECGNRGYRNIKPQRSVPPPKLRSGDVHTLRAEMARANMNIYIDDTLAWQGPLSSEALKWNERVGIRSDNVRVQFELRTGPLDPANAHNQECRSEAAEAE
ncbi:MAG: hypothetical protein ACLPWG_25045 [Steroidobacteraceae bacterium]